MQSISTQSSKAKLFNYNLEALRGVAALVVVWGHAFYDSSRVDPAYSPGGIWLYTPPAHLSVLVFFLLSGYVIGLAHAEPLTITSVPMYLKKRFFRIYPIYLLCLALALVVTPKHYSLSIILSHLTMNQGITSPLIVELSPAWSLVYEVLFYLLFVPVSIFRLNPVVIALLSMLLGCLNTYFYPSYGSPLLSSYAFGFAFWLSGLALAKYLRKPVTVATYASMLSLLSLLLAVEILDAPMTLFTAVSSHFFGKDTMALDIIGQPELRIQDFAYLPYCIVLVAAFAKKKFRYIRLLQGVLIFLPMLTYYHYYKHFNSETLASLFWPTLFYVTAVLLFLFPSIGENFSKRLINRLIVTGSISYGLYIVHYPILSALRQVTSFSGSLFTFGSRLTILLALSIGSAILLEKKFQPWIRKTFN
ncbi:MAG: acyltransferase [Hymenobacter sp.]|nr:MAG: acyltransferase [Hymenobacter sp.]